MTRTDRWIQETVLDLTQEHPSTVAKFLNELAPILGTSAAPEIAPHLDENAAGFVSALVRHMAALGAFKPYHGVSVAQDGSSGAGGAPGGFVVEINDGPIAVGDMTVRYSAGWFIFRDGKKYDGPHDTGNAALNRARILLRDAVAVRVFPEVGECE